ncbi:MAG: S8 family serine peptidase [Geodermatophilaceae bacterium]
MGRRTRFVLAATVLAMLAFVVAPVSSALAAPEVPDLTAGGPLSTERVSAPKAATSRVAQSDPSVLEATGTEPTAVVVKLDYDSLATYAGNLPGYDATSPSVTNTPFDRGSQAARRYEGLIDAIESRFLAALSAAVPEAVAGTQLRVVYGGVALVLPANRARDLLALPGVVAVQGNGLAQPLTDSSPEFIGAPTLYDALGSDTTAGEGAIVGVLDSGGWPEHPSYVDPGIAPPPPRGDGEARVCDFGDNPLTPRRNDPFVCNDKLISGEPFLEAYNQVVGGEVYETARDSNGHGTHTSTTSAGAPVANAVVLGVDRGAINGIAPGAHVAVYKVCGLEGCFSSDSAAAVGRSIEDGVDVINFSISGGTNPYSDPVELAFLDAYAAGVFVSASAGNDGPGAGTVNHVGPWLTSVAASTQERAYESTLTVTGTTGTFTDTGASITAGAGPAPVVLASAAPYNRPLCDAPAPAGLFTGKIVACERGVIARVEKGYNVLQGGAAGMILYNPALADIETDNHWLPTVHLADGTDFLAFMAANPNATATFTAGQKATGQGDVMAAFSSRGPGGDFLKPDVTAPGVQILAGHTPTPESIVEGPPGQLFQAIAGTSMSAPHVAGSAALLVALHPDWTPGQIKSALMTTATTDVVKEDTTTPADPFDMGAGRIDLTRAGDPGLTFDETARAFTRSAADPTSRLMLNIPSVNAPLIPGAVTAIRTATNVTSETVQYQATGTVPAGATIIVAPSEFTLAPGESVRIRITIKAIDVAPGQYFGQVNLNETAGDRDLHLPVAFSPGQGSVTLTTDCVPDTVRVNSSQRSTCTVGAQNTGFEPTRADLGSTVSRHLVITSVSGAVRVSPRAVALPNQQLAGREPGTPSIDPGELFGYLPLAGFGVTPDPIGDEEAINLDLPEFTYAGETYAAMGVTSNGYAVVGGAESADIDYLPQDLPDPVRPNNVLAPYWTDLDGTEAPGVYLAIIDDTDTGESWFVSEWQVNLFGTDELKTFQMWVGLNGTEDITFAYDPENLPGAPPPGYGLTVGAENVNGSAGDQIEGPPTQDLRVTSTPGTPGGVASYTFKVGGVALGNGEVSTRMVSPAVQGVTIVTDTVNVRLR